MYAVKVGEMHVVSEIPVSEELRKAILQAVHTALKDLDGDLGLGAKLIFRVEEGGPCPT